MVLALQAHNWPGNLRDLELFSMCVQSYLVSNSKIPFGSHKQKRRFEVNQFFGYQGLANIIGDPDTIYMSLAEKDVNVVLLEQILNEYDISLSMAPMNRVFGEVKRLEWGYIQESFKSFMEFEPFERAYKGLEAYCALFFCDVKANKNLLDIHDYEEGKLKMDPYEISAVPKDRQEYHELLRSIFEFRSHIEIDKRVQWPADYRCLEAMFMDIASVCRDNPFMASLGYSLPKREKYPPPRMLSSIWTMGVEDLLDYYYEGLLERTGGNMAEAAEIAGVNYQTFRSRIRARGLTVPHAEDSLG
jgi:hypothetical protein